MGFHHPQCSSHLVEGGDGHAVALLPDAEDLARVVDQRHLHPAATAAANPVRILVESLPETGSVSSHVPRAMCEEGMNFNPDEHPARFD